VFQLWFVPTEKGREAFQWEEKLLSEHETRDDALFEEWDIRIGEPHDRGEYARYEIREVSK
jgi:hypothetical protein